MKPRTESDLEAGPPATGGQHESKEHKTATKLQIEDHPTGYPRYSALIASHDSFQVYRRFTRLRSRLHLIKQDKLSRLEKQLDKLDRDEDVHLFLGSCREDDNLERQTTLAQIDKALAEYDDFIERSSRILAYDAPDVRQVANLRNWIDGNRCIARAETEYLTRYDWDLLRAAHHDDNAIAQLEAFVVRALVWVRRLSRFRKHDYDVNTNDSAGMISRDPQVHIFSKTTTSRISRILMIPFVTMLLMAPVIICQSLSTLLARTIVIVLFTSSFTSVLSGLTRARTVELVIAGATGPSLFRA
ncbi:hypothetical protein DL771_005816 [Monosporascus sp. 5C6A]|nr:hypothetical protein DL771_005816 [Monosporascus sp. 5C6A]